MQKRTGMTRNMQVLFCDTTAPCCWKVLCNILGVGEGDMLGWGDNSGEDWITLAGSWPSVLVSTFVFVLPTCINNDSLVPSHLRHLAQLLCLPQCLFCRTLADWHCTFILKIFLSLQCFRHSCVPQELLDCMWSRIARLHPGSFPTSLSDIVQNFIPFFEFQMFVFFCFVCLVCKVFPHYLLSKLHMFLYLVSVFLYILHTGCIPKVWQLKTAILTEMQLKHGGT